MFQTIFESIQLALQDYRRRGVRRSLNQFRESAFALLCSRIGRMAMQAAQEVDDADLSHEQRRHLATARLFATIRDAGRRRRRLDREGPGRARVTRTRITVAAIGHGMFLSLDFRVGSCSLFIIASGSSLRRQILWPAVFKVCMDRPLWMVGRVFHAVHHIGFIRLISIGKFLH